MPTPLTPSRSSLLALFVLGLSTAAFAQPVPPSRPLLWVVEDADSRVYLLGSIHALPAGTDVLPGPAAAAYAAASVLAFEVDLDDAEGAAAGAAARARATDGVALSKRLGPADAARLEQRLQPTGLTLAAVEAFEPWFVALLISNAPGDEARFSFQAGVDVQLFARAGADGKERLGLETADDQVGAFDGLAAKDQLSLLRDALGATAGGDDLGVLVAAWEAGDADAIAAVVEEGLRSAPALRQRVFTDRNARWVPQVEALLGRTGGDGLPEDVLVVVGVGHLVGPDSVVEMLRARGLAVERVAE